MAMASSSESKKQNGQDGNVFTVLKHHDVVFNSHVQLILGKLGFTCLRSFALLDPEKIGELEENITTLLGSNRRLQNMSEQEKIALFGELFADDPKSFRFLPGEKNSIIAAVHMSQKLISDVEPPQQQQIFYLKEDSPVSPAKKRLRSSTSTISSPITPKPITSTPNNNKGVVQRIPHSHRISQEPPSRDPDPMDEDGLIKRKGKTLHDYLVTWLSSTKHPVEYNPADWDISETCDTIACVACKTKPFKVSYDRRGGWKPSTFFRHLILFHTNGELCNDHSGSGETLIVEIASDSMDDRAIASIVDESDE